MSIKPFVERTAVVYGDSAIDRLRHSRVAVFGLGGVGATAAVDVVRCGVGHVAVADFDRVSETNLNRLVFGFQSTVGANKTELFQSVAKDINPEAEVSVIAGFLHGDDMQHIDLSSYSFVIDAIDSLNPKVNLIVALLEQHIPFISVMGTGGRADPTLLRIGDFWKTNRCSLARFVRKRLRKRGVTERFPAVWSEEIPVPPVSGDEHDATEQGRERKQQGSTPFVPQTAGHFAASYAVKELIKQENE